MYSHINSLLNENVSSISFTSDIWSSDVSPMSMLSLTAQWINADFQLCKAVLHSQEFSGSRTAAAQATAFDNMFETWHIPKEKVRVILRDNPQNMVKGTQDAGLQRLESERLFSAASNIMDEHRNRLSPEKAEMLLFIKNNLPTMLKALAIGI